MFAGQLFVPNVGKKMLDRKQFLKTMYAATFYSGEINYIALSDSEFVCLSKFVHFLYQTNWTMPEIYLYWWIYTGYTVWLIKVLAVNIQNLFLWPFQSTNFITWWFSFKKSGLLGLQYWQCFHRNRMKSERSTIGEKNMFMFVLHCNASALYCECKKRILRIYF